MSENGCGGKNSCGGQTARASTATDEGTSESAEVNELLAETVEEAAIEQGIEAREQDAQAGVVVMSGEAQQPHFNSSDEDSVDGYDDETDGTAPHDAEFYEAAAD